MASRTRPWPIPTPLIMRVLPVTLLVMTAMAAWQAGPANWIQGINYLVAALPLTFAIAGLLHARRTGNKSARLYGAVYLATFWAFCVYGWQRIEQHKQLIADREQSLAPTIAALEAIKVSGSGYPDSLAAITAVPTIEHLQYARVGDAYRLLFTHNIVRAHVYEPATGWRDEHR